MTLTEDQVEKVIQQICEGKEFYDSTSEYYEGEAQKFFFFREEEKFFLQRMDVIVGSYCTTEEVSREDLKSYLSSQHLSDFKEQGFVL